jgi:hypothetical protein
MRNNPLRIAPAMWRTKQAGLWVGYPQGRYCMAASQSMSSILSPKKLPHFKRLMGSVEEMLFESRAHRKACLLGIVANVLSAFQDKNSA